PLPERRVEHRVGGSGEHQVRISAREDAAAASAPAGGRRVVAPAPDGSKGVEVEMAHMHDGPDRSHIPAAPVNVEMGRSGHIPVVAVKINGRGPYRFGLDTGGAGSARIDSALAASLGLKSVGQARAGDPSGKNMQTVDLVQVKSIEIGGARFEGVIAPIRSETLRWKGEPIVGILGFNLFRDCLLTLDFPGNRLT